MKLRHWLRLAALLCLAALWGGAAQAAISCSVMATGFTLAYDPTQATPTDGVSSVTINCTRAASDASSVSYTLIQDGGLKNNNRATLGSKFVNYALYQDAYLTSWGTNKNVNPIVGSVNFGAGTSATVTLPYYIRIAAGQNVPAGGYADAVTATLTYGGNLSASSSMTGLILVNSSCQFSTPPGTMAFAYTSFQAAAASASTPFAVLCTNGVPYTLSLDTTSGTLLGIAYTLALSASASTGTGAAQAFSVNGSIAGGQAGTCATGTCSASNVHTLTVSY